MAAQPSVAPTPPAASAPAVAKADDDIAYRDGWRPKNAVSTARDAVLTMDGIEITRPTNIVDDLLPGVTLEAKEQTATPVRLAVETNREAVKDSLINFVANYNKALVDINTLTRSDDKVVSELDWLSAEELEGLRKKLGAFSGDSSLNQMRSAIVNAASSPYTLPGGRTMVLSELGIGTDMARRGGYDPSKLRGYLEIDEKILDSALLGSLDEVKAFFGSDTDGDLIVDSGLAFTMDRYMRPYVETGGIITNKTVTIDSRIARDESRMENLDRQLASKEQSLKNQYGQMEGAYNRMDRMSSSLDSLNNQDSRR
jgi:flagellar hook-associated protein 2